jgi:hypothetical protein
MLVWACTEKGIKYNPPPLQIFYMNLETTRNRSQDEVREDGRLVGGKEWKERVYNREEWKKVKRMLRNCRIMHVLME